VNIIMNKIKLYFLMLVLIILLVVPQTLSFADEEDPPYEYSDFSNAVVTTQWNGSSNFNTEVVITDVANLEGKNSMLKFSVYLSHDPTDTPNVDDSSIWITGINCNLSISETSIVIGNSTLRKYFEEAGEVYLWIREAENGSNNSIVLSAKKLQRLIPNDKMIAAAFRDNKTQTLLYTDHDPSVQRKINYKIGVITEQAVIIALKNGDSNAYSLLMNYAKNNNPTGTGKINLGDNEPSILGDLNIIDKKMYYGYLELDDEDGKYHPVEDVEVYYGLVASFGTYLHGRFDTGFEWALAENSTPPAPNNNTPVTDNTTATGKLPDTGEFSVIIATMSILSLSAIVGYVKYKRLKI